MKVSFLLHSFSPTTSQLTKAAKLKPMTFDTVSFSRRKDSSLRKGDYEGFDYFYLDKIDNKLSQNIFATKNRLYDSAKARLEELQKTKKLSAPKNSLSIFKDKTRIVEEWKKAVKDLPPTTAYIIFASITGALEYLTDRLPAEYDEETFQKTLSEVEAMLQKNKGVSFNFNKKYKENLKIKYVTEEKIKQGLDLKKNDGFWIEIPSWQNDPENYENNVKRIKALGSDLWCTKAGEKAHEAIMNNNFYIFAKSNEAKMGVRLVYGLIFDVQGKLNDYLIPFKHVNAVDKLIQEKSFKIHPESKFHTVYARAKKAEKLFKAIPEELQVEDYFTIMQEMGLKPKLLENDLIEIEHYHGYPSELDYFKKYGITEEKFFSKIERIRGNAYFRGCNIKDLMNLKEIGGDAVFSVDENEKDHAIKSLGKLECIGGDANFYDSMVEDLGELKEIGGNINCFGECHLTNLGKLKHIKGNAYLPPTLLESTRQLETLGNREFIESRLKS